MAITDKQMSAKATDKDRWFSETAIWGLVHPIKHPKIYLMDICKLSSDLYNKQDLDYMPLANNAKIVNQYKARSPIQQGISAIKVNELIDLDLII